MNSKWLIFKFQIRSSSKELSVGHYAVFHVKTNFPFNYFDWLVVSKDIIWNSGREYGDNIHPEVKTFSLVVSSELAPGFHVVVHSPIGAIGAEKELVSGTVLLMWHDS